MSIVGLGISPFPMDLIPLKVFFIGGEPIPSEIGSELQLKVMQKCKNKKINNILINSK